jgi:spoIIIJ-associated protein
MMIVEEEGRTADEALERGLARLGLGREYLLVEVIDEGARGFLGLGRRPARIRLTLTPTGERLIAARGAVADLVKRMGVAADVRSREVEGRLAVEISGGDAGLLIGKQGQTLEALTFLAAKLVSRQFNERIELEIDVEGYRERRRRMLEQRAVRLAQLVKSTGEPVEMEPMSSGDRRTIHMALQLDGRVRTSSEGEGPRRRLVIAPTEHGE